jgi:hypothetical protein
LNFNIPSEICLSHEQHSSIDMPALLLLTADDLLAEVTSTGKTRV